MGSVQKSRGRPQRIRGERGAAAVEFALVVPLLFMIVFGIIDFGFGFHAWDAAENAAREGARVAAVDPDPAAIIQRARSASSSALDQSKMTVTVTCSRDNGVNFAACGPGSTWNEGDIVRVTITYDYQFVTPLPTFVGLGRQLHETVVSEARFEGQ